MTQSRIDAFTVFRTLPLQNVLRDFRDCMSWRLSDAALLRPCVWSGRKHAVLASHHGIASAQMLCMSLSALTDLCLRDTTLQVPSLWQSGSIVPPEPGALTDHVMWSRQQALGGISSDAEAAATPQKKLHQSERKVLSGLRTPVKLLDVF